MQALKGSLGRSVRRGLQTLTLLKGNRLPVQRHAFSKTVDSETVYLPETHTLFSRTYPSKSNKGVPPPSRGRRRGGGGVAEASVC